MAAADAWTWVGVGAVATIALGAGGVALYLLLRGQRDWGAPLRRLAERNGWTYEATGPERLLDRFGRFGPLRPGRPSRRAGFGARPDELPPGEREARHVITGRLRNSHFHLFEYDWEVPPQRRRKDDPAVRRHVLVAFRLPETGPDLRILRRDRGEERVRQGEGDVTFPHDARFERRFRVLCNDPDFARRVLHPGMREFLLRSRLDWEWKGRWLVAHWDGRLKAKDCLAALRAVIRCVDRLPPDLRPPAMAFAVEQDEEAAPDAASRTA